MTVFLSDAAIFGPTGFTDALRDGRVPDEVVADALTMRGLRPLSRTARLAMAVAARVRPGEPGRRDAVVFGSAWSSVDPLASFVQVAAERGADQVFPMAFPNTVPSVHAGYVATLLGCTGPVVTLCGRSAGLEAIVEGVALLEAGRADRVLAIGADAAEPTVVAARPDSSEGAAAVRLSSRPEESCLAVVTGCWTATSLERLPVEARAGRTRCVETPERGGAGVGAATVAAAARGAATRSDQLTLVGRVGVRGVAALRIEPPTE